MPRIPGGILRTWAVAALACCVASFKVTEESTYIPVSDVFPCKNCETAEDCHVSLEWEVWATDGNYVNTEINATRVCVKHHLTGCNGPKGPEFCDASAEKCASSVAFFDERARTASHSICSKQAYQSSMAFFRAKTLPILLAGCGLLVLLGAGVVAYTMASMQPLSKHMLLLLLVIVAASYFTFWSPFLLVGVAGVLGVAVVVFAHSRAVCVTTSKRAVRRWLMLAAVGSMLPLCVVYLSRNMFLHALGPLGGETCSAFYDGYFEIDPRLLDASHNSQVKYHSLCSRGALSRATWNASAVVFLSCLTGTLSLVDLASKHQSLLLKEDQERLDAEQPPISFTDRRPSSPTSRDDVELPSLTIVKATSALDL